IFEQTPMILGKAMDYSNSYCGQMDFLPISNFRRISSIKHHLVIPDCNRFAPTKAVNQYQLWFTHVPSASDTSTNDPAMTRMIRSILILHLVHSCNRVPEPRSATAASRQLRRPSVKSPVPEKWDRTE